MNRPLAIPPVTNDDRLPHDQAVWREGPSPPDCRFDRQVSVDYGDGLIEQTVAGSVVWHRVTRWRWGWSPS
jgi:hypothetical protein